MIPPVRQIKVIDSHTGGEPTRVVVSGGPDLGSGSVADRLTVFRQHHDSFRSAVVNEPRGSDVLVGALLVAPADPACATGVVFFNNVGYLGMCGHGTIGLIVTLAHLGRIKPGEHRIETSVGVVTARLHADGSVSVANVPSYRKAKAAAIDVPGIGNVTGDVAWGGNWFFLVEKHGLALDLSNVEKLTDFTWRVRQAVNAQGFPEVDHIELFGPALTAGANSRNFVLCPGKAYDRSPCGTGTSAKLACLAADGKLREGEPWVQESIIGSTFTGRYRREGDKILPTITGHAFVTAESTLLLDKKDPFCWGIRSQESPQSTARSGEQDPTPRSGAQESILRAPSGSAAQELTRRDPSVTEAPLVRRSCDSPPPPAAEKAAGFSGWRTRGYLPHFNRKGLYRFVTFRLADAFPRARRGEWQALLDIADERTRLIRIEEYLDRGFGSCFLNDRRVAELVQNALLQLDGERYRLFAWVIMPNHVHALLEVLNTPLARILHSWKAFTSLHANRLLGRTGRFWQVEYFDRDMRDLEHFRKTIRYIENNPVKARLAQTPDEWHWSSRRFNDPRADRSAGVHPARRLAEINSAGPESSNPPRDGRAG